MNGQFIPLVPVQPLAGASSPTAFTSVAPGEGGASASHLHHGMPKVTLTRDGDRVTHIHVHCVCGQTIELACQY